MPNHNSHLKALLYCKVDTYNNTTEKPQKPYDPLCKHFRDSGKENSHLTGRNLLQNQAQGEAAHLCACPASV